ncbi:hypothetical protein [Solimonas sp. K1W22B-7]|uniref:hypothetical protein n=1 Tax=Solimonas sp. K1W22B-7 TaxID=2303331 RepID=UPI0013C4EB35|nr:hypothetical protein [Solimonas sp. K1W22B-7]
MRLTMLAVKAISVLLRPLFALMVRTPAYKKALQARIELVKQEEATLEDAEWFGTTGLHEEIEWELPRYLRRELGQSLFDEGSLKANDLKYVGVFLEQGIASPLKVHYWRMPYQDDEPVYAYVDVSPDGETCTGWGNQSPPASTETQQGPPADSPAFGGPAA